MRLMVQLGLVCLAVCASTEMVILHSFGLFDFSDRVQASVANLSIRPTPVFAARDARIIRLSTSYAYKGASYVAMIEEGLGSSNYEFLEDSDLYARLASAMKNGSKIELAINPTKPAMPMLLPDLHLIRLYGYLVSIFIGVFVFASARGRDYS